MQNVSGLMAGLGAAGAAIGGLAGFLARPALPLIGQQLPFAVVVSRGAGLQGMDLIMVPLAQRSFNIMLLGVIVGAVLGVAVGYLVALQRNVAGGQAS